MCALLGICLHSNVFAQELVATDNTCSVCECECVCVCVCVWGGVGGGGGGHRPPNIFRVKCHLLHH